MVILVVERNGKIEILVVVMMKTTEGVMMVVDIAVVKLTNLRCSDVVGMVGGGCGVRVVEGEG